MTEFVRVKDATTGAESTVSKRFAEAYAGKDLTILKDKAAVDANGRPLAAKTVPADLRKKDTAADSTGDGGGNTPAATDAKTPASSDNTKGGSSR
jgi:hypothetical protein